MVGVWLVSCSQVGFRWPCHDGLPGTRIHWVGIHYQISVPEQVYGEAYPYPSIELVLCLIRVCQNLLCLFRYLCILQHCLSSLHCFTSNSQHHWLSLFCFSHSNPCTHSCSKLLYLSHFPTNFTWYHFLSRLSSKQCLDLCLGQNSYSK